MNQFFKLIMEWIGGIKKKNTFEMNDTNKKPKIQKKLSLKHPDECQIFPKFNTKKKEYYESTIKDFENIYLNLKENNFNMKNKVFHPNYNILLKDVHPNYDFKICNKETYLKDIQNKFGTCSTFLYHLYKADSSIRYIYPNIFNKKYLDDLKLDAKDILFKYYPTNYENTYIENKKRMPEPLKIFDENEEKISGPPSLISPINRKKFLSLY